MRVMRVCMVGLAFALAGCATARHQASIPAAPMRADDVPEERQRAGWPPYYPPRLVRDLVMYEKPIDAFYAPCRR